MRFPPTKRLAGAGRRIVDTALRGDSSISGPVAARVAICRCAWIEAVRKQAVVSRLNNSLVLPGLCHAGSSAQAASKGIAASQTIINR